ncbi:hypothetical protein G6030_03585 [Dietzia sp. E1]|uniref:hypothetical protein n=1 Tax=Dietzia sp. E1 TaxID=328361 RepID=UPI0015FE5958|nr:hypothetical protein [Dietzia sp. E1]MBB1020379.1 hypothetical protein [Dietzia sp. E1]
MPDFSAISAALTAVTNAISGLVTLTGSLTGDGLGPALEGIGLGDLGSAAEETVTDAA